MTPIDDQVFKKNKELQEANNSDQPATYEVNATDNKKDVTVLLSMLSSLRLRFWVVYRFAVFCPIPALCAYFSDF